MATVGNFRKGCAMRRSDAAPASFGGGRSADVSAAYPRPEPPFSCGYPERGTSERSRSAGCAVGSVRTESVPAVRSAVVGTVSAVCSAAVVRQWSRSRQCVLRRWSRFRFSRSCGAVASGVPARSRRFSCAGFGGYSLRAVFCGKYSARRILSKVTTEERRGCGDRSGGGAATRKGLSECSDSPFSAERSDGASAAAIVCDYNRGPAATSALPSSLPVNLVKFFTKRLARSTAFVFHSSAFL